MLRPSAVYFGVLNFEFQICPQTPHELLLYTVLYITVCRIVQPVLTFNVTVQKSSSSTGAVIQRQATGRAGVRPAALEYVGELIGRET